MEQPSATTSLSELSDDQSLLNAEGTPGDGHSNRTEESSGVDHINTPKIEGGTDTEKTLEALLTDTSQEETPRSDNRDTTQKLTGDQINEKALGAQGDTSPQETTGVHPTDRSQEDPTRTDHCDTTPQGTSGAKDKDTVKEEPKVTQGITEPEVTTPDPKESEGAGGEEKQKEQEGDNTVLGGASGEEEVATEEVEVGGEQKHADVESSAQATEDTVDETTSPAEEPPNSAEDPSSPGDQIPSPAEEEREAEEPPQKEAGSPETSLAEGPGSPEVAEGGLKTGDTQPDGKAEGSASGVEASAEGAGPGETEKPPAPEKKKPVEKKRDVARSRTIPKSYGGQSRKAIMEKFGGPAAGPAPGVKVQRSTSFGASSVKNMLLEWCKAKTRDYEHVDIQNFSSSWSSGMAFCALVHKFFPEEFDYATLDPKNRRHNFEIAFSTAEKRADCAQLLEVDDMVRMRVPDSKCVYTYIQELYRSLVQMGLVKTKKQ